MGGAHQALEHSEHIAHAGHGGGGLSTRIGITIAVLGVFLAIAGAKVGAERTELVAAMVEQQHAHAEFQMQNIKHRMTVLVLREVHAEIPAAKPAALISAFDDDLKKVEADATTRPESAAAALAAVQSIRKLGHAMIERSIPQRDDTLMLARLVDRYFEEQDTAQKWVATFDPAVKAHSDAQEQYEWGQLAAEFGVVICSLALLFHSRLTWAISLAFGFISLGIVIITYQHTAHVLSEAQEKIEAAAKIYEEKHLAGKTRKFDKAMVDSVIDYYGGQAVNSDEKPGEKSPGEKKSHEKNPAKEEGGASGASKVPATGSAGSKEKETKPADGSG